MTSLKEQIQSLVRQLLNAHPAAFLVWCDPRGEWASLLRGALQEAHIALIEVDQQTAGKLGGPIDRARVQQQINTGVSFVLRLAASPEDLGWLWAQALRAERIYSRTLRDQLTEWGWRPQSLHISDQEIHALAEQNIALDPAAWSSGGLEPNLDLLLNYLVLGNEVEGTQRVLLNLSAERAGLNQPDPHDPETWRMRSIARLLVTDAYRRAPKLIPALHELLIPAPDRTLALQLIDRWLDSRLYSTHLITAVNAADPIAALDSLLRDADATIGPFLSRRAEQALYDATCQQLAALEGRALLERLTQLQVAITAHASRDALWSRVGEEYQHVPWRELARLADACQLLLNASPTRSWPSPQAALDWYIGGGWQVDRAGEELLRNLSDPDPALVTLLNPLRSAYRAIWEQQLMAWSEVWQAAGCPQPPYPSAGERLLKILEARRPTAIIVIDALRYDLGQALAQLVNQYEHAPRAEVLTALAPLPSVTALGMGMALPIPSAELRATCTEGRWTLQAHGQELDLSAATGRRSWWITHGHVAADGILATADVLSQEVPNPGSKRPRLVVLDHTIDDQGHDGELEVAGAQDVLRRYLQVIQRLRDAGWRRVVVVTDHGYIHWAGQHDQRVAPPAGDPVYASRRAYAYRAGTPVVGAQIHSPGDTHPVAVPHGVASFAAYGKRGYYHGGASLQEWIIPVISIDWPTRARPVELAIREQSTILSQRPRIILTATSPSVMFVDEFLAREVKVLILHAETREVLFASEPQTVAPTDETVEMNVNVRRGAIAARGTALIIEARDAKSDAVLASTPSRLLIELRQTDDAESW